MDDAFWQSVCGSERMWFSFLGVNATLLFLLLFSFLVGSGDTALLVVSVMTLCIVVVNFVIGGYMIKRCRTFREERRSLD